LPCNPEPVVYGLRTRGNRRSIQQSLQPRLHRRPFAVDDAEVHAVPAPSIRHDHVVAKDAFLGRADAQQRGARAGVQRVGLELDPEQAERLEGVQQHEILRFGVDHRAAVPA
jgi:hypothetical protein